MLRRVRQAKKTPNSALKTRSGLLDLFDGKGRTALLVGYANAKDFCVRSVTVNTGAKHVSRRFFAS